jgi:arsenate reductase
MSKYTYYHNPRCSKSRQGLELLDSHGADYQIKLYLEEGLAQKEIKELIAQLDLPLDKVIRVKEAQFKELGIPKDELTIAKVAKAISDCPKLLERPILSDGRSAVQGRPPENITSFLGL